MGNPIAFIFDLLVTLFGYLMNLIYTFLDNFGIGNIALSIIIFTLITRILLYPSTVKQQKSSKLMAIIQPEIKAIQSKYEGKTDQQSMMAQQAEIKAVYEKYGTSMTASCVQLLVQMPIIFALYQVIMHIPKYVGKIRLFFENMVNAINIENPEVIETLEKFSASNNKVGARELAGIGNLSGEALINKGIDFLYTLNPEQMKDLASKFPEAEAVITRNFAEVEKVNTIFGLNLSTAPNVYGFKLSGYILIPILAAVSQYATSVIMQKQMRNKSADDEGDQMQQSMKTMNLMMPIMSAVFCWGFATGIGVYWIASSLFMMITYLIVNKQLEKLDIDQVLKTNIEKVNKKRAKKGLAPINEVKAADAIRKMEETTERKKADRENLLESQKGLVEKAQEFYFKDEPNPDSLSAKANMVKKYNEKHNK